MFSGLLEGPRLRVFKEVAKLKRGARFAPLKAKLYPDGHDNTLRLHLRALVDKGFLERKMDGREAVWKAKG